MDIRMTEAESRMEALLDKRIAESEARMEALLDKRIAELKTYVEALIDKRIVQLKTYVEALIDKSIVQLKIYVEALIADKIKESENILLEEIDRTQGNLESKIRLINENTEELRQYYKITKLENDSTAILLKMIDAISKKVEDLEKKIA